MLAQFRVADREIGARTSDTEVTLRDSGAEMHSRLGLLTNEAIDILRLVFASVSPPKYEFSLLYQFLVPITDEPYEAARLTALNRLSDGFLGDVGVVDFAMLLDGRQADTEWHCEFGIVSDEEVEARLRRQVGRMRGQGGAPWTHPDLPTDISVAFFADFVWHPLERSAQEDGENLDGLTQQIQGLGNSAVEIVSALHARLCEGSVHTMAGGA